MTNLLYYLFMLTLSISSLFVAVYYLHKTTASNGHNQNNKMKEANQMMLKLIEKWDARLPAEPERTFPGKNGPITFPALKDRTVTMALLEAMDGSGCRAQVELPDGTPDNIKPGAVLQLEVPDYPDSPLRSRRLTRVIDPSKDNKI